jgi:muramoyltetrapeptide carboxypeptidase
MHAPMAAAFNDGKNEFTSSLRNALAGIKAQYETAPQIFSSKGVGSGLLIGGNLALLCNVIGTPSDFDTKGKILFVEDTGEYLYNVDRMFHQLKRSGKLKKLAGLIIGGFTEMKDTERPFGKTVLEIIREITEDLDCPVCFDFPVSHSKQNVALKIGLPYQLKVNANRTILKEL